jgi:hypothetical protein
MTKFEKPPASYPAYMVVTYIPEEPSTHGYGIVMRDGVGEGVYIPVNVANAVRERLVEGVAVAVEVVKNRREEHKARTPWMAVYLDPDDNGVDEEEEVVFDDLGNEGGEG